ncbi:NTP transferase domain-containing protein [Candidatus Bathyarchaeota archaeon]|nr:NTP transferase domain-containing protein [Candidatus Bathyarchaeota archaeon]NIV44322.1 NTP transferase domain-containing protein [Candidatus Bathyarchaeota archaeon]
MKAVILAAGLGTRLLPVTKGMPKEMFPIFNVGRDKKRCLKPLLQLAFEQLHDIGFREFCFVVSQGKHAIEDYFTPDESFLSFLRERGKEMQARELQNFYFQINECTLSFVNQPELKGTGDAVQKARSFTADEPFLLHMGDDVILSRGNTHLKRLIDVFTNRKADVAFLAAKVKNPSMYGVIVGKQVAKGLHRVETIIYQPKKPPSNLSDVAAYMLRPNIYAEIQDVNPLEESGEISLIPAIQALIDKGGTAYAVELKSEEKRLDIGNAEKYREALNITYKFYSGSRRPQSKN